MWRPFAMRKRCTRRHYYLDEHPVRLAAQAALPISGAALRDLRIVELMSLEALTLGQATPTDLGMLRRVVVLAKTLADAGIGPEVLPLVDIAWQRPLTEPLMVDVLRELVALHDQQREAVSRGEYEGAVAAYLVE